MSEAGAAQQHDGTVALVTGAASGIGAATARRLAASGMTVAAADLDAASVAQSERVRAFPADVADGESVAALAEAVSRDCGVPGVIVNCAGWDETRRFTDTDRPFWERVVATVVPLVELLPQPPRTKLARMARNAERRHAESGSNA